MPFLRNLQWKTRKDFFLAQIQVAIILAIARFGDRWEPSYPRNDNHDPRMFWIMNGVIALAALASLKRDPPASAPAAAVDASAPATTQPSSKVVLLSRSQTEEWKGWMQWAFIMYHYYRAFYVYNEIRCFVSAYVWMTGFGNYLYFSKKRDFSVERIVSMWLRINYFPLLLSFFVGVKLELYYVVPLHTVGFFVTMATCYVAHVLEKRVGTSKSTATTIAIISSLVAHVVFYETPLVDSLLYFGKEYHFRFQSDKYSALLGIISGLFWKRATEYMQWAHGGNGSEKRRLAAPLQFVCGLLLIFAWYFGFGHIQDKYIYNPIHPYVFLLPVAGWLMVRNSSRTLTEVHSTVLEFFGRITLETYVLQFHLFMCNKVQHIPMVLPGSGPDGPLWLKTCNMLLCGTVFVAVAYWARKVTVTTQNSVTELVGELRNPSPVAVRKLPTSHGSDVGTSENNSEEERASFLKNRTENGVNSTTTSDVEMAPRGCAKVESV